MMRRTFIAALSLFALCATAASASAQTSTYGKKYAAAADRIGTASTTVNTIQSRINAERVAFNQGMRSRSLLTKQRAKERFLGYMSRLQRSYLTLENRYGSAIYWGSKYSRGLYKVRRTQRRGVAVGDQVRGLKAALTNVQTVRKDLEKERVRALKRY